MFKFCNFINLLILFLFVFNFNNTFANDSLIIQSTTSTKNSGFYNYIKPIIKKKLGLNINVVAVGTGAAIRNAINCDGDLLIVHSKIKELSLIKNGFAKKRYRI